MNRLRWSMFALVASVLAACSPIRVADALLQTGDFVRTKDVVYGSDTRERLDVYRPRSARGPSPVVIFLYGGRWQSGSKDQYGLLGDALTRRGVVAVIPDYRLYPSVKFPGWVDDAVEAVKWTRRNIQRFGGDTTQIWIVGHSAGGHTVALLALDEHYLRDVGLASNAVKGFVSIAGPVDTEWTDADVQALMGPREGWPATYPRNHINGSERPLLLLHGSSDKTVSPRNSESLAASIRERGGCARSIIYRGVGHVEIVVALAVPGLKIAPAMDDLLKFMRQTDRDRCPVS